MSNLLALQWMTSAALVCGVAGVLVGIAYLRAGIRSQRAALGELAKVRAVYLELARRRDVAAGRALVSLKCRIYGDKDHRPCAGTTDDGTDSPCACWCHLPTPPRV